MVDSSRTYIGAKPDGASPEGHQSGLATRGPSRGEQPVVRVESLAEDMVVGFTNLLSPRRSIVRSCANAESPWVLDGPTIKVWGTLVWNAGQYGRHSPDTTWTNPAHLAIQDGSQGKEVRDEYALQLASLARVLGTKIAADPPYVAHGRVDSLDVELVFETDGQAVQGSHRTAMLGEVLVQLLRPLDCLRGEILEEARVLYRLARR